MFTKIDSTIFIANLDWSYLCQLQVWQIFHKGHLHQPVRRGIWGRESCAGLWATVGCREEGWRRHFEMGRAGSGHPRGGRAGSGRQGWNSALVPDSSPILWAVQSRRSCALSWSRVWCHQNQWHSSKRTHWLLQRYPWQGEKFPLALW